LIGWLIVQALVGTGVVNDAAALDSVISELKTVEDRLLAAEPQRLKLLHNLHYISDRINPSELDAIKDRLAEGEKAPNKIGYRQCSFSCL